MLQKSFPRILLFILLLMTFSCGEKPSEEIYSGKLEELMDGELIIIKDSLTKNIEVKHTTSNSKYLHFLLLKVTIYV